MCMWFLFRFYSSCCVWTMEFAGEMSMSHHGFRFYHQVYMMCTGVTDSTDSTHTLYRFWHVHLGRILTSHVLGSSTFSCTVSHLQPVYPHSSFKTSSSSSMSMLGSGSLLNVCVTSNSVRVPLFSQFFSCWEQESKDRRCPRTITIQLLHVELTRSWCPKIIQLNWSQINHCQVQAPDGRHHNANVKSILTSIHELMSFARVQEQNIFMSLKLSYGYILSEVELNN